MNKTVKSLLFSLGYMAAYFAILLIVYFSFPLVPLVIPAWDSWWFSNPILYVIINDIVCTIIFFLLFPKVKKESLFKRCNFSTVKPLVFIIVCVIGVAISFFTSGFFGLHFIKSNYPAFDSVLKAMLEGNTLSVFIIFLITGSIYKEILFRALIFKELKSGLPFGLALIIQGIFYGVMFLQANIPLMIYGTLGAIIFALLYTWFESLWSPIAVQIASTGGLFLIRKYAGNFIGDNLLAIILISFAVIAAGMYFLFRKKEALGKEAKKEMGLA